MVNVDVFELRHSSISDHFAIFESAVESNASCVFVPRGVSLADARQAIDKCKLFGASGEKCIGIFSSGTTGKPKLRIHTLTSLLERFRGRNPSRSRSWLTYYSLATFAGLQVAIQAWYEGSSLAFLSVEHGWDGLCSHVEPESQYCLSATPSILNLLSLQSSTPLHEVGLVSMGGEIVRQKTLDSCSRMFPRATCVHIYATSEVGTVVTVKDGKEGLPLSMLDNPRLAIIDGELFVERSMLGGGSDGEMLPTGDLVEIKGDRIYFSGRVDSIVTVGGASINLEVLEAIALGVPGVTMARATAVPSSIMGHIITLEVVVNDGFDEGGLRVAFSKDLRPARISIVSSLGLSAGGKLGARVR